MLIYVVIATVVSVSGTSSGSCASLVPSAVAHLASAGSGGKASAPTYSTSSSIAPLTGRSVRRPAAVAMRIACAGGC